VALVVDTAFVLALARARDDDHQTARAWMETSDEDLVTSPLALAEMDSLIGEYLGERGQRALWSNLDDGVYAVRWWADAIPGSA
jgi:predicted nucleic acid-binding protein